MAAEHKTERLSSEGNEEFPLPPTPYMRCVSRFSSWSSFHSSRPSSERACCGDTDSEDDDDFDFESNADHHTSDCSDAPVTTNQEALSDSQSPHSVSSDLPPQDNDSGYGSPPTKPSYLEEPPSPSLSFSTSFSTSRSRQEDPLAQPRVSSRFRTDGEPIEIIAVPADSLMDCICRPSYPRCEEVNLNSICKDEEHVVTPSCHLRDAFPPCEGEMHHYRRTTGILLKGLRIWTPTRFRPRQHRQKQ